MPDPYDLAEYAADLCLAESPDHFLCTEDPNHDGDHRAEFDAGNRGEPVLKAVQWPQETL